MFYVLKYTLLVNRSLEEVGLKFECKEECFECFFFSIHAMKVEEITVVLDLTDFHCKKQTNKQTKKQRDI